MTAEYASCGPPLIQSVLLVERYERSEAGFVFETTSLPGHLLHLIISGKAVQEVSGYESATQPGHVIWYHEDELVRGRLIEAPWMFLSVNFTAPNLIPPAMEKRTVFADDRTLEKFERLLQAWRDAHSPAIIREINVQTRLLDLLANVLPLYEHDPRTSPATALWWSLETRIRRNITEPTSLTDMRRLSGMSNATIIRACLSAVGTTPMKRVKLIRLSLARGLVHRTKSSFTEIAARVGYARVHEFSRDYKHWFGTTPSNDRLKP